MSSQSLSGDAERAEGEASGPEFSVIITCYFEVKSIEEFHGRLTKAMRETQRSFEIVLIDDGSTDETYAKLQNIFHKDPYVSTVAKLFRNSGQICAMSCGISYAKGQHFIFMDSDLQMSPEELPLLIEQFDQGYDIVSGYRKDRKDSPARKFASYFANIIMRKVSGHRLSDYGCTFKIYHGLLIRAFGFGPHKAWKTAYVFAQAQRVKEVPITHAERKYGKSGWTLKKLISFLMDHVVGISRRPFQIVAVLCAFAAGLFFLRIALAWVLPFTILSSVTEGMLLNAMLLSFLVTVAVISVVGEYVIRNFTTLQGDPIYVVRELMQKERGDDEENRPSTSERPR